MDDGEAFPRTATAQHEQERTIAKAYADEIDDAYYYLRRWVMFHHTPFTGDPGALWRALDELLWDYVPRQVRANMQEYGAEVDRDW